jgi:ABC-type nitrate/sulfonate/bicarbonate transport system substrate-binding protein
MAKSFVVVLTIFILQTSVQAADKIRISIPGMGSVFMTFPMAYRKGFLKEEGVEAEIIRISSAGGASRATIASGEVDYGVGIAAMVRAALSGLPVKVVACHVPVPVNVLVAQPNIKSVPELKGKTIGILSAGSPPDFMTRMIARHFGLDPERDIKLLSIGPPEARFVALNQGIVHATLLSPPFDFEAKNKGFNVIARANEIISFPETGLIAGAKKIQEKPDEIKRVIRAGIKATRYIRGNRGGTIQFLTEWLKINREVATATHESVVKAFDDDGSACEKGIRVAMEESTKALKINRDVPLSEVADLSILRETQRELGIKGQ